MYLRQQVGLIDAAGCEPKTTVLKCPLIVGDEWKTTGSHIIPVFTILIGEKALKDPVMAPQDVAITVSDFEPGLIGPVI